MVELRRAVLFLGESKLEVAVKDQDKARLVVIQWKAKNRSDMPPKDWAEQVDIESTIQRDDENRIAAGKPIL